MVIFDIETDGIPATKIHCVSYSTVGSNNIKTLTKYSDMRKFFLTAKALAGHYITMFDIPTVERLLGIKVTAKLYDTLAMSWHINPTRTKHGLEDWGEFFGVPKPKVHDWENQPLETYIYRCEEDVKINIKLWNNLMKRYLVLYKNDKVQLNTFLQYLTFKMQCAQKAEETGWPCDYDKINKLIDKFSAIQDEKVEELKEHMPLVPKYVTKTRPKKMYNKKGELTVLGNKWQELLAFENLPPETQEVKVVKSMEAPNPNSSDQVKDWLFSLGWEPCTYDYKKNDDGTERKIPQVRKDGHLTDSVLLLTEKYPQVEVLDGLTVAQHRLGIVKNFLASSYQRDGKWYLSAKISGFTNTLRFKHAAPLVNLPGVDKPYGEDIRSCLLSEGDLCGCDMVSLEDTTKRHFIQPIDPEYVEYMSTEGYDPHLDLAVIANQITKDEYQKYVDHKLDKCVADTEFVSRVTKIRKKAKVTNYSSTYGVGKLKLARSSGMTVNEAASLIEAYWKRNWAIKKLCETIEVRGIQGQLWLLNPVNNFWYSLRYRKDIFSTLNQGTGAYCFDTWLAYLLAQGVEIYGQFHDEYAGPRTEGHDDKLIKAAEKLNQKLKLNVELKIDWSYGKNYAEVH